MISLPGPLPLGRPVCHDTTVMTYAAYLRVYEPASAFPEPDRSRWAAYAVSPEPASRPARRDSLAAEHLEALRAAIDAAARGDGELAEAMYKRARSRWRALAEFEMAN
jgi:hypothetical protein